MLLRNACALVGPRLSLAPRADIGESGGAFDRVVLRGARPRPRRGEAVYDCEGLLAVPALVNAHTHVGDSIAKDAAPGRTVDERVHPVLGAKPRILARSRPDHLESMMRAACASMLAGGTTTFADFREGGVEGAAMLARAASGLPVRAVILGRLEAYGDAGGVAAAAAAERRRTGRRPTGPANSVRGPAHGVTAAGIARLLSRCDGIGLSGPNENSDAALGAYARAVRRPRLRAIHAAETAASSAASRRRTGRTEAERALLLHPHILVHMTHATDTDLRAAARAGASIVVCPRSNAALGAGLPDVPRMLAAGCRVALGTDNVMVNAPDMFREMDYLGRATEAAQVGRGGGRRRGRGTPPGAQPLDARAILRMATVDGGAALRRKVGAIARGMAADCMLIERHSVDLEPMHDPWAAVVHRASASSVRAVVSGGRIVHGRI